VPLPVIGRPVQEWAYGSVHRRIGRLSTSY